MSLKTTDAFILCGGLGTRLRESIGETQKVITEVDGIPFLDYILKQLDSQGVGRVILGLGFKAETLEEHYSEHPFQFELAFSKEEELLGTGGAIKHACTKIQSDPFLVLNGDSYCEVDFEALIEFHKSKEAALSIVVSKVKDGRDFGGIRLDKSNRIAEFKEKDEGSTEFFVNAGIYCLNQKVFDMMPTEQKFSIETDIFQKQIIKDLYGFRIEGGFLDIGTPDRLEQAKTTFKKESSD